MNAKDYRRIARERLAGHWLLSVGVTLAASLLGGSIGGSSLPHININADTLHFFSEELTPLILRLLNITNALAVPQFILGGVICVGNARYLLHQHDELPFEFKTLFSAFEQFGTAFWMHLLRRLYVFLWSLLFIIPGIVAGYSYAMAPYIMADNPNISASEALRTSRDMMRGHRWELFCLELSFLGWAILSLFTLGIGQLFLAPYRAAARTAFYRRVVTPWVI